MPFTRGLLMNEIDKMTEKKQMRKLYLAERAGIDSEYRSTRRIRLFARH